VRFSNNNPNSPGTKVGKYKKGKKAGKRIAKSMVRV
jgi:hypothetical protein